MKKFYLGLDIGTDSVGIACTDEHYELLRAKGKDLWAVRLFDEAHGASERRVKRTARRRTERRKQRIAFLQELFAPFMTDEQFFLRLQNSGFYEEDKKTPTRFSLFADENYTDKEFYAEYPTVYHLRKALAEKGAKDIRLYYLAIHHIVKYRGHFLFEGESAGDGRDLAALFEAFDSVAAELFEEPAYLPAGAAEAFTALALDGTKRYQQKLKEAVQLFGADAKTKEVLKMLLGGKGKPSVFLGEFEEEKSFSFEITEEEFAAKEEVFGDCFALLDAMRKIYNTLRFEKILGNASSVSEAMVALYERHREDLKDLKRLLSRYYPHETYVAVFKKRDQAANYANYIGYTKPQKTKKNVKKCSHEEFCRYLKGMLQTPPQAEEGRALRESILARIEAGEFLPKILNADNGVFPHQVNLDELDKILARLCSDFPAFAQKDGDGLTPAQKIRSVFLFRVPYYVGPLDPNGPHSWMVRRAEGRITPWNFDEKVDKEASNENFIRRMTGKCAYLMAEDVLPKCSMYYQAFDVLNQLNKLRINGEPISVPLKQELFRALFMKEVRVTDGRIKKYLVSHGYAASEKELTLTGKEGEFKANMRSYIKFKEKLGDLADERPDVCENIILWHTLGTDKGMVERAILKRYGDIPAVKENIKWIKGLTQFKEFGRLSKKFLCELSGGQDPIAQAPYTVLGELYRTNCNLNEILFGEKYTFQAAIARENGARPETTGYSDVEALYVAPQVRRGIWQALLMTDEYVEAIGRAPDKIFVEVTRQKEKDGARTVSRKNQLLALYRDVAGMDDLKAELGGTEESKLRQERLYLYFRQLGKCMYSGQQIDLGRLNTDLYDVDHIIPRSLTKDDSLDNKVLVLRTENKRKEDRYPLPAGFTDQREFWKVLREKKLISDEKWARLTRQESLTEADYEGFINRQLVYTNQTAKAVAELLRQKFERRGTEIVYSKAANVTEFRQKFHLYKCRETNDLHHARDAYLNVVVGNVYAVRFTSLRDRFRTLPDGTVREIKLDKLFLYDVAGAWEKASSLRTVKNTLARNSMAVTKYAVVGKDKFYKETVFPKGDSRISAPRKGKGPLSDPSKYGGYSAIQTAYFAVVQSLGGKGVPKRTIEAIPTLVEYECRGEEEKLLAYLRGQGLVSPVLLVPKLRIKSLVKVNGSPVYLAGVTGSRIVLHNAVEWFTDNETDRYVKKLSELVEQDRKKALSEEEQREECFPAHVNRFNEVKLAIDRVGNERLYDEIVKQLEKTVYDGISGAVNFRNTIIRRRENFRALSVLEQAKTLLQIIRFLRCNAENADLSALGEKDDPEGKICGALRMNKDITDVDFRIIHQSPCGLHRREQKV